MIQKGHEEGPSGVLKLLDLVMVTRTFTLKDSLVIHLLFDDFLYLYFILQKN